MIKLRDLIFEAKNDLLASRVWDYVISNEVWVTEESLKEISDKVALTLRKNIQAMMEKG